MGTLIESKLFKIIVIGTLLLSLITVVVLGKIRQKAESEKWQAVLAQVEEERKSKSKKEESAIELQQPVAVMKPLKNYDIYKGASELGQLNNYRWRKKNWYALGDNITAANSYQERVKYSLSMASVVSDASPERAMSDMANNITVDKLKDIDIVTVFAGTSDYSRNTPLGTIEDDENSNTFYGSLHKTIRKIVQAKPEASVVFFTPLKRGAYKNYAVYPSANSTGVKLEDYAGAIQQVCRQYNILVFDLFNESGITEGNIKGYTTDNLNLNSAGSERISKLVSDYMKKIK